MAIVITSKSPDCGKHVVDLGRASMLIEGFGPLDSRLSARDLTSRVAQTDDIAFHFI
jgi:hypothetical protein